MIREEFWIKFKEKKVMINTHDAFFHLKTFGFWNFFVNNVKYKISFEIILSKQMENNLNIIDTLRHYSIEFDEYLVSRPLSRNITIDILKPNLPVAYFAHIIDIGEKNESIISLYSDANKYLFKFEFLK